MESKLEQNGIGIQFKWNGIKDDLESESNQFKWNGIKADLESDLNGMESKLIWNQNTTNLNVESELE